tara:strand:+ start:61 stop:201 length:141 start_codon:yes stop_codon:yes gene_type:complete
MNGKYFYEFVRDNNPNILGSYIIEYVEKLKTDNDKLTKKLKKNETL